MLVPIRTLENTHKHIQRHTKTYAHTHTHTHAHTQDIGALFKQLPLTLDLSEVFTGLHGPQRYRLRCMVCFFGQHYVLLAYKPRVRQWVKYDDTSVKAVGDWAQVIKVCIAGRFQYNQPLPSPLPPPTPPLSPPSPPHTHNALLYLLRRPVIKCGGVAVQWICVRGSVSGRAWATCALQVIVLTAPYP